MGVRINEIDSYCFVPVVSPLLISSSADPVCAFPRQMYCNLCVVQDDKHLHGQGVKNYELECGPMPNVTAALPNIGGALCSMPQSLADAHYCQDAKPVEIS